MKKGFTLLELIVVIIIIGILATLGITQYGSVMEKARGGEAKQVLSMIRSNAAAIYMLNNSCTTCTDANLGVSAAATDVPSACRQTNYFKYATSAPTATGFTGTATRCIAGDGGKTPAGASAKTVILTTDFSTGADTWTGTGL